MFLSKLLPDVVPHDRLLVLADEDAVRGGAVEVVPGGENLTHSVHVNVEY